MNFDPHLASHTKIKSKWTIYLKIKPKTTKFLQENVGDNLCELGLGKAFLNMIPKAQPIKEQTDN